MKICRKCKLPVSDKLKDYVSITEKGKVIGYWHDNCIPPLPYY